MPNADQNVRRFSLRCDRIEDEIAMDGLLQMLIELDDYDVTTVVIEGEWQVRIIGRGIPPAVQQLQQTDLPLEIEATVYNEKTGLVATYLK